ncbi:unnamed protein product [Rotaria sordida]|uniref:Hermes trasposase DNA-binding domain-containing protein n=1 Tax=Rotaria sordida TaxID=392033 RepID=A0A819Q1F9_9BILA|nr:unnamed protein product [Rotaria sordida]CAF4019600.1 unnamed protein product [Rotaria sordida]
MSVIDKDSIKKKLDSGEFKSCDKPTSASAGWWQSFKRIQDEKENIIPFVICIQCKTILFYDAQKTGSKTLKLHHENCKIRPVIATKITTHFTNQKYDKVSSEQKKKVLDSCVKFCACDMRSFNTVNDRGVEALVQTLLDIGHSSTHQIKASDILSDSTTISRRVQSVAHEEKKKLIITLKNDINDVKLFGITCDYWKNSYTSDTYLTINIHYGKDGKIKKFMLKTMIFTVSKTGENTWKAIYNTLESFLLQTMHPI